MNTDPIADYLTRIRNASSAGLKMVQIPASNLKKSRPGLRKYTGTDNLPRVLNGLGVAIMSTSRGVITDKEARKLNVGGEVLCYVY